MKIEDIREFLNHISQHYVSWNNRKVKFTKNELKNENLIKTL